MKIINVACFGFLHVTVVAAQEPVVDVAVLERKGVTLIRATHKIQALQQVVWSVLTDCPGGKRILSHFESCRIVSLDLSGRWDIREHVMKPPLLPRVRTVARNDFEPPHRLSFKLIKGDLRVSEGTWTLTLEGKVTRVKYEARVAPSFSMPQFLLEAAIRRELTAMLLALDEVS
jgi:hypothetical protein